MLAGVVVATAAMGFVALAFAGGDSSDGRSDTASSQESTTTSERRRSTTTTSPEASTTTAVPNVAADPGLDVIDEPIGDRRVIVLRTDALSSIHLDTNVETVLDHDLDVVPQQFPEPVMFASGENVFIHVRDKLYVVPQSLDRNVREVGEALVVIASRTPGRVWAARERDGGFVLDEVTADGTVIRTSRRLPVDAAPLAAVSNGFVLAVAEELQVWDPATGQVRWTSPRGADLVGATDHVLVWRRPCAGESPLCVLHVVDVRTGTERLVSLGGLFAVDGYQSGFEVSPDGRYLAASSASFAERPDFRLSIIDLETGLIAEANAQQTGRPVWSADGNWVFLVFGGEEGQPVRTLFRFDRMQLREVGIRLPLGNPAVAIAVL